MLYRRLITLHPRRMSKPIQQFNILHRERLNILPKEQIQYRYNHHGSTSSKHGEPPAMKHSWASFPSPHVLLVTLNRPLYLNAINVDSHYELEKLFKWYDDEP